MEVSEEGPGLAPPERRKQESAEARSGARLIQGSGTQCRPGKGIINTRGQGRAAGTMGRGRVEKAAGDEHRAKATLWQLSLWGLGGAAGPRRALGLEG